jgi:hypothetical protein
MDLDLQKSSYDYVEENPTVINNNIYKYYSNVSTSIVIYDSIIYPLKTLEYDYKNDELTANIINRNIRVFIKLCYDEKLNNISILSDVNYKVYVIEAYVDENGNELDDDKLDKIAKDILIQLLESINSWFINNPEVPNIFDLIIRKINSYFRINISKRDISSINSHHHHQTLRSNTKQIKEKKLRLQNPFYKYDLNDETFSIIINENHDDYYFSMVYEDEKGRKEFLISSNITKTDNAIIKMVYDTIEEALKNYHENNKSNVIPEHIQKSILEICKKRLIF